MTLRIEQDDTRKRDPFDGYTYRIYDGNCLVASFWHDYRGDEHGIDFLNCKAPDWPFSKTADFIAGGGNEPVRLSDKAVLDLQTRHNSPPSAD